MTAPGEQQCPHCPWHWFLEGGECRGHWMQLHLFRGVEAVVVILEELDGEQLLR